MHLASAGASASAYASATTIEKILIKCKIILDNNHNKSIISSVDRKEQSYDTTRHYKQT